MEKELLNLENVKIGKSNLGSLVKMKKEIKKIKLSRQMTNYLDLKLSIFLEKGLY